MIGFQHWYRRLGMQEEYTGRWTHLHFKSKEIIDRLKIDGVRVVERLSDYLESFDKLTINSNNQRNDAI
jgi:hypothetical protein